MGKDENTIQLQHPVEYAEERVSEVTVRRPKGKDLKGLKNVANSMDDQLRLVARLIGKPDSFVGELDMVDLNAIMQKVSDFLPDGP